MYKESDKWIHTHPTNCVSCYSEVSDGFALKLNVLLDSHDRKSANSFDSNFFSPVSLSLSVCLFPVVMTRNSELNSRRSNSAAVRQFFRFHTNRNVLHSQNIRHDFVFTNWLMTTYPFAYYINQSFRSYICHSMYRYIYQFICRAFLLSIHQSFNSVAYPSNWTLYCNISDIKTYPNYSRFENHVLHSKLSRKHALALIR